LKALGFNAKKRWAKCQTVSHKRIPEVKTDKRLTRIEQGAAAEDEDIRWVARPGPHASARGSHHRVQGECRVPLYTRESVSLSPLSLDEALSRFALSFTLRHYTKGFGTVFSALQLDSSAIVRPFVITQVRGLHSSTSLINLSRFCH